MCLGKRISEQEESAITVSLGSCLRGPKCYGDNTVSFFLGPHLTSSSRGTQGNMIINRHALGAPRIVGCICNVLLRHQSNRAIETSASSSAGSTKRYRNTRHSPPHRGNGRLIINHATKRAAAYMLSAPTRSATCAFFASAAFRISAGSPSRPRATWSVWRGARKVVEPGRRARVACTVSL